MVPPSNFQERMWKRDGNLQKITENKPQAKSTLIRIHLKTEFCFKTFSVHVSVFQKFLIHTETSENIKFAYCACVKPH